MKYILTAFCSLTLLTASVTSADVVVFQDDFTSSTAGNLPSPGALGAPIIGTTTATGGKIGSGNQSYATNNNGSNNAITTIADGSFNDVGTPSGNYYTAMLSSPAAITGQLGTGQVTTVDFQLASHGVSNETAFKYGHIIGLSSTGDEVFQMLWRAGSSSGSRELYAREDGQDNTTFVGGAYSSVDGTKILDNVSFNINGTGGSMPSGRVSVSVEIDENGWNASSTVSGGGTITNASGLGIASGATDLASIVFFTSHNASISSQNKGLWVDNVIVETDLLAVPEPSSIALFGTAALGLLVRRRR